MSSAQPLIPQSFWFRTALWCRRLDGVPRAAGRRGILDLPPEYGLPALARLDGREPWAELRVAWNAEGLAISACVSGKSSAVAYDASRPDVVDGIHVWVDTRDTRDMHRASRFCHRFTFDLVPAKADTLDVYWNQRTIGRALADPPRARNDAVLTHAEARAKPRGWLLEVFLKGSALNGFDPETNRRLGFLVQVNDADRGDQFLTLGREFPIGEDPSLWPTLELVEG